LRRDIYHRDQSRPDTSEKLISFNVSLNQLRRGRSRSKS
jgi:hypothetical protein